MDLKNIVTKVKAKYPNEIFVLRYMERERVLLSFLDDNVDEFNSARNVGVGINCFSEEGQMGFAGTNLLDEDNLLKCAQAAHENMLAAENSDFTKISGIKYFRKTVDEIIYPNIPEKINVPALQEKIVKIVRDIRNNLPKAKGVFSLQTIFMQRIIGRSIYRTDGTCIKYKYPLSVFIFILNYRDGSNVETSYVVRSGKFDEILSGSTLKSIKDELMISADTSLHLSSAPKIEPGSYKLILDGKVGGTFIHEAFGHCAEADAIKTKSPLSTNGRFNKGEVVAPLEVNVLEGTKFFDYGFTPYDEYGFKRKKTYIVKNGKLNDFLSDIGYYQDEPRGFTRAESWDDIPIPRMSMTVLRINEPKVFDFPKDFKVMSGDEIYRELLEKGVLKKSEKVIYLSGSSGGQVNTKAGTFQFNSEVAYIFENGKSSLIKGVSFSGSTLGVLDNILSASKQIYFGTGVCGKRDQNVEALDSAPYLTILDKSNSIKVA